MNQLAVDNLYVSPGYRDGKLRLNVNLRSIITFLIATLCPYTFVAIGEMFYVEVLLIPFSLILLLTSKKNPVFQSKTFQWLVFFSFLTLTGYILSDLIQGTRAAQYLRGWGRSIFLISDVICLGIVIGKDKRLFWWFCLGYSVGQLLFSIISGVGFEGWKLYYASAVAILTLVAIQWIGFKPAIIILVVSALFGLTKDSRSDPAIILLLSAFIYAKLKNKNRQISFKKAFSYLLLPLLLVLILGGMVFSLNKDKFSDRQKASNIGRNLSLTLGFQSIVASPIIGVGSWNDNKEISEIRRKIMIKELGKGAAGGIGFGFSPHSQILQSWYEGGILGASFFIYFLYLLISRFKKILMNRPLDAYSGIVSYLFLFGAWHLIMSPFAGNHRMTIAMSVMTFVLIEIEENNNKKRIIR